MKQAKSQNPPKRTFTYIDPLVQIPVAILIAMMVVWPTEETMIFGVSSRWFFKPFMGMYTISLIWLIMANRITIRLDKQVRWEENFAKRSLYQLIFGWAVPVLVSFFAAKFYFRLAGIDVMKTLYSQHMYIGVLGLPLIINCGYMFYYLFYFFRVGVNVAGKIKAGEPYPDELIFQYNREPVKLKTSEIAYIFAHGKTTIIQPHAGEPIYLKSKPLKQISTMLNPGYFCQVNKAYIISLAAYVKHRRHDRGYLLFLKPEASEQVIVSRARKDPFLLFIGE